MNLQLKEKYLQPNKRKRMEDIHNIKNGKSRRRNPSKKKNVPPKEINTVPNEKGMNTSRRKIPPKFVVPPSGPLGQKRHVVQHKKFPKKRTITQKIRMQRLRAMSKRQLLEEMP